MRSSWIAYYITGCTHLIIVWSLLLSFLGCSSLFTFLLKTFNALFSSFHSLDKEMTSAKERLEIESVAQRSTLQDQRSHIEILDKALNNAQTTILRLEEEVSETGSIKQGQHCQTKNADNMNLGRFTSFSVKNDSFQPIHHLKMAYFNNRPTDQPTN